MTAAHGAVAAELKPETQATTGENACPTSVLSCVYQLAGGQQGSQAAGALRCPELAQRFSFDLADSLARDVELLPDFFERVFAFAADAEAQPDDFLLFR